MTNNPQSPKLIIRVEPVNDWQPIETAPKDGKPIWLGHPDCIRIAWWDLCRKDWIDLNRDQSLTVYFQPTNWMPLPEPPKEVK